MNLKTFVHIDNVFLKDSGHCSNYLFVVNFYSVRITNMLTFRNLKKHWSRCCWIKPYLKLGKTCTLPPILKNSISINYLWNLYMLRFSTRINCRRWSFLIYLVLMKGTLPPVTKLWRASCYHIYVQRMLRSFEIKN